MAIQLYGHPFASFAWKAFIAAYERDVAFEFCMVDPDHPDNSARMAELSPTGQFPALIDGDRHLTQSNSVIEYLDRFGDAAPIVPDDLDDALDARMLAYVFDSYVAVPVQQIVGEALRPKDQQDQGRVAEAKLKLDKSYAWLSTRIGA